MDPHRVKINELQFCMSVASGENMNNYLQPVFANKHGTKKLHIMFVLIKMVFLTWHLQHPVFCSFFDL